jgi:type I restriction enzyme, R subunit
VAYEHLLSLAPTVDSVDELVSEEVELAFVKAFRDLMRLKNVLTAFSDFSWEDIEMTEQQFEDYKSKYLDLHEKVKTDTQKEKASILEDVDFELELIHRDEINVAYIIQLLIRLKASEQADTTKAEQEIMGLLNTETTLRSKRELIEKFILENLPEITKSGNIEAAFEQYWSKEQRTAFETLVTEERLYAEKTQQLIDAYLFAERQPLRDEVLALIEGEKPGILQRKSLGDRILAKIMGYVEVFIEGLG